MSNKINTIEDLVRVVTEKYNILESVSPSYLNAEGHAAKEAYRNTLWYLGFYDNMKDFSEDEGFQGLVAMPNKHPEYYRTIRMINRAVERALAE